MGYAHGTVMRGTLSIPVFNKIPGAKRKAIATVGVPDLQDRPSNRFALGTQEHECAIHLLDDR